MRPIKFRAWETHDKRMIGPKAVEGWKLYEMTDEKMGWIPMQFTGLHDKNGKEIWEGDIVRIPNTGKYADQFLRSEVVEYDSDTGTWAPFDPYDEKGYSHLHFEVLGNIYENPELLRGNDA